MPDSLQEFVIENALLDMILERTETLGIPDEVHTCLKLAERLIEHAGYRSAGNYSRNDVVEMMLISAQAGKIADKLAPPGK